MNAPTRAEARKVNGSELLPLVRAGVRFIDGVQEKPTHAADLQHLTISLIHNL